MIIFFGLHRGKLYNAGQSVGSLYDPASVGVRVLSITISPSPAALYLYNPASVVLSTAISPSPAIIYLI